MSPLISFTFPSHRKSYNTQLFHQNKHINRTKLKLLIQPSKEYPRITKGIQHCRFSGF